MADVTVHHLENSRGTRILWLLEELGLAYDVKTYERNKKTMHAPKELHEVHPLGRSPIVEIDGQVMAESGAIIEFILHTRGEGRLRPEIGTEDYWRYIYFLHYAEGSTMTSLFVSLLTSQLRKAPVPFFLKPVVRNIAGKIDGQYTTREMQLHVDHIESHLKDRPYFAGEEFTAADIQMSYPLAAMQARAGVDDRYPRTMAHISRTRGRDAYKRAELRGGPMMPPR